MRKVVIFGEVISNDRDWQGEYYYTGNGTKSPNHPTLYGHRVHVTIANCCHGNQGPPKACGDILEDVRFHEFREVYES